MKTTITQIKKYMNLVEYSYRYNDNKNIIYITTEDNIFTAFFISRLIKFCDDRNLIFSFNDNQVKVRERV